LLSPRIAIAPSNNKYKSKSKKQLLEKHKEDLANGTQKKLDFAKVNPKTSFSNTPDEEAVKTICKNVVDEYLASPAALHVKFMMGLTQLSGVPIKAVHSTVPENIKK
jgi:hypothetical protein